MLGLLRKFIPPFLLSWYHFLLSLLGATFYRFPAKKITVIGITGTNGKSTVTHLASEILTEAGFKVASVSSIRFKIGNQEWPNTLKMTMPGRFKLQKFIRRAVDADCKCLILEVTSEGIKQHRHRFIDLDTAVFTNLTREHIESHGSFKKYRQAKGKLFAATKGIHILNTDDDNAEYFLSFSANKKYSYGLKELKKQGLKYVGATNVSLFSTGINFTANNVLFDMKLLGSFNVYNALTAICIGLSQGVSLEICKRVLEKTVGVPGRMEVVAKEPSVIVDYAHTPDSLEKVYKSIKSFSDGNLICLLGSAGGGRDKWKRPEMGKIAANYCDKIVLANEDPYDENPEQILQEVKAGIHNSDLYEVLDREQAIKKALSLAQPKDTVIITGKGCEPWMCIANGKKISWDDREIVRKSLLR
ncbi:UDP-N-acetylmuramoyl-L-alanyl-D-glutamate--2,6-diaminopimelate ligase [Candidatus Parcubacteria bacterium]|nr:UDP-N-acetylmuramoyl-L-alanyl-D-glutamate--2,6-diaminopimelate ligase [Candidatus Parcubacteria bacterium]